jgi:hypothetical protein
MSGMGVAEHFFVDIAQGGNDRAAAGNAVHVVRTLTADADHADVQSLIRSYRSGCPSELAAPETQDADGPSRFQKLAATKAGAHGGSLKLPVT